MASAVLGKVSPTPKGEYVSTQDYDRLDVVTYEGYPYLAKSNVPSGNLPTDELYWMPLLVGLDFAPGGYGLGGQVPLTTADAAVQTGFYRIWLENTLGHTGYVNLMVINNNDQIISQTAFGVGKKVFLRIYYNTWGDWVDWSPSAFAPSGYVKSVIGCATNAEIDNAITSEWSKMENSSIRHIIIGVNVGGLNLQGGRWNVTLNKNDESWGTLTAISYPYDGLTMQRALYNGVWLPWEWCNPPMVLGVEYRTTERWNGKPVYAKQVYVGLLPNNAGKYTEALLPTNITPTAIQGVGVGGKHAIPIPSMHTYVSVDGEWGTLYVSTDSDYSNYGGYITVKYTKG